MRLLLDPLQAQRQRNGGMETIRRITPRMETSWPLSIRGLYRYALAFLLETALILRKFWEAGRLRRLPVAYTEAVEDLLELWLKSEGAPSVDTGGATGSGVGTDTPADTGASGFGDLEMAGCVEERSENAAGSDPGLARSKNAAGSDLGPARSENAASSNPLTGLARSENAAGADPLMGLALQLDLISPETPLLSEEDRHDLALLDSLTQTHTRVQQVLGLETEIMVTERWNFEAARELLKLANNISSIPFGTRTELFDLEPTRAESGSAPGPSAAKGKSRLEGGPKKRSLYHMLPHESKAAWAGSVGEVPFFSLWNPTPNRVAGDPLPPMPPTSELQDFKRVLGGKFPDLFGPMADHHCQYREHLFQLVAADLQQASTQKLAGAFFNFWPILVINKSKPH